MKKILIHKSLTFLMALCLLVSFTGCRKTSTSSDASSDVNSNETLSDITLNEESSGTVASETVSAGTTAGSKPVTLTVGISATEKTEFSAIIPVFQKKYPHIKVQGKQLGTSLNGITAKWTSLAAAGTLPDVVIGSENFGYIMQQGWAYPLDNLLAADADKSDILQMGLERFTYGGHLYALPFRLQFNTIVVNLDLLETLNMKKPDYNWTLSTFVDMAKKATNDKYSGLNYIYYNGNKTWGFDNKLMGAMLPQGYEQFGYNLNSHNVDLTANNAWVQSIRTIENMKSVPGLVADDMKNWSLRNNNKDDDYDKKFGKNADAFKSGKVLFGNHSTWEFSWVNDMTYKWDFYPVPTQDDIPQRIQTHVDFVFLSSALQQDKSEAAFKLAKFLSYDKDGCNARIDYCINKCKKDTGVVNIYIPATQNAETIAQFDSADLYPKGVKYMLKSVSGNPTQTLVADCDKIVPDFWSNVDQYRDQAEEKVSKGADPASLVNDMQTKINSAMNTSWDYLQKKIDKNLADFYTSHPYEAK